MTCDQYRCLEQVADPVVPAVEPLRVELVQAPHAGAEIRLGCGQRQVIVVSHQAVGRAGPAVLVDDLGERVDELVAILVGVEDGRLRHCRDCPRGSSPRGTGCGSGAPSDDRTPAASHASIPWCHNCVPTSRSRRIRGTVPGCGSGRRTALPGEGLPFPGEVARLMTGSLLDYQAAAVGFVVAFLLVLLLTPAVSLAAWQAGPARSPRRRPPPAPRSRCRASAGSPSSRPSPSRRPRSATSTASGA